MFELVVSPALLAELERALGYPKLRRRIPPEEGEELIELLRRTAAFVNDPPAESAALTSSDPGDDYLLALAMHTRSVLVSGDSDLLTIDTNLPIHSPAAFMALFERD
jgi:putative PIN family toxin of toxin-antitoxin system